MIEHVPYEIYIRVFCIIGGLVVGAIVGFCAACYTASDLGKAMGQIFNYSPKDY